MNGSNGTQVQVNPIECARAALMFLQRVQFTAAERNAFDSVEAMLNAIAQQHVMLVQPPALQDEVASPLPAPN